MQEREGTIVGGRYHLQRCLGRGGMSEVYLATDEYIHRNVAIKLVGSYGEYGKRFQREIKTLCKLTHSHILPALDYGEDGPWYYLVMPYIEYGTLHERLARGPLALEEVGDILEQLADALQYMHDRGIIHRDIKPSNILLHDERYVYLADFGLARAIAEDEGITRTGYVIGTPEYMAPELVDELPSASSDIYALGILLYQMLTGRVPFRGGTPYAICWKHVQEQPVPLSMLNPAIPRPIEQVILCALEKDPRHRFASAHATAQAYMLALVASHQHGILSMQVPTSTEGKRTSEHGVVTALETQRWQSLQQSYRRWRTPVLLMMLLAFILLFAVSLLLGFYFAALGTHVQVLTADLHTIRVITRLL